MRILTIVMAVLLALLPDCTACLLCDMDGGPCSPVAEACCEGEGCAPAEDAPGEDACTCGSACDEGCLEPDPALAAFDTPAVPAPAAADLVAIVPWDAAPRALPAPAPRSSGPPPRLPLRI